MMYQDISENGINSTNKLNSNYSIIKSQTSGKIFGWEVVKN